MVQRWKSGENSPVDMGVSKNRVPQNGWFMMENPIKMDDLGVPLFLETPRWFSYHPIIQPMGFTSIQTMLGLGMSSINSWPLKARELANAKANLSSTKAPGDG